MTENQLFSEDKSAVSVMNFITFRTLQAIKNYTSNCSLRIITIIVIILLFFQKSCSNTNGCILE